MDLHPGEEIVFDGHPSWRATLGFYLVGFVAAVVVAAIVGVAVDTGVGVAVVIALLAALVVIGYLRRMATHYVVTTQRLRIRRGILSKRVQQTHIDRVQNVNTHQTLLARILRIGTVDFDTAGTDDSDFTFQGIADPAGVVAAVDRAQRTAATQL
jgi:uncharacterized membrane protein YdbT with pleckstrin-like domain